MGNSKTKDQLSPKNSLYYRNVEMTQYFISTGKIRNRDTLSILNGNNEIVFEDKVLFLKHFKLDEDISVFIKAMNEGNINFLRSKKTSLNLIKLAAYKYIRTNKSFNSTMEFLVLNNYINMSDVECFVACSNKQYLYLFSDYGKCIYGLSNDSDIVKYFIKNIKTCHEFNRLFKYAISLNIEIDIELIWMIRLKISNPYPELLKHKTKNSENILRRLLETKMLIPENVIEDCIKSENHILFSCTLEYIIAQVSGGNSEKIFNKILTRVNSEKVINNATNLERKVLNGVLKIEDVYQKLWQKQYLYLFPENLKRIYGKVENQEIFDFYQK